MGPRLGALIDTVTMPFIFALWGLTTLGCISWGMAMLFMVLAGASFGWIGVICVVWSAFAFPIGWRNYGRFLDYFDDREEGAKGLLSVTAWSVPLLATNPLLVSLWLN